MKKIITTLFALSFVALGNGQELAASTTPALKPSPTADFSWANTTFDFKKTKVSIPVSYEFRFSNIGMVPLIITSVKASCGCTITAYTKDPVEKGSSGFVRATYDAAKTGKFTKTIAVNANTPEGTVQLTITGEVIE
ncbi:MAG: DUF1573 domain-containing protein [Cyclobacteriaceae bacterium]